MILKTLNCNRIKEQAFLSYERYKKCKQISWKKHEQKLDINMRLLNSNSNQ